MFTEQEGGLRRTEWALHIHKYWAIGYRGLTKGLEHLQILVSTGVAGTNPPKIPQSWDDCIWCYSYYPFHPTFSLPLLTLTYSKSRRFHNSSGMHLLNSSLQWFLHFTQPTFLSGTRHHPQWIRPLPYWEPWGHPMWAFSKFSSPILKSFHSWLFYKSSSSCSHKFHFGKHSINYLLSGICLYSRLIIISSGNPYPLLKTNQ